MSLRKGRGEVEARLGLRALPAVGGRDPHPAKGREHIVKIEFELSGDVVIRADGQDGSLVILEKGKGIRLTEKDRHLSREEGRVLGTVFQPMKRTAGETHGSTLKGTK
jgi:hypothetical protein